MGAEIKKGSHLPPESNVQFKRLKHWEEIFALGDQIAKREKLTEADIAEEIRQVRMSSRKTPELSKSAKPL